MSSVHSESQHTEPTDESRRRVLTAARHLIAERGLGVSMDEIADAAGVGRRTLFRHFGSRDDLVAAAVSSALDWYDVRLDLATRAEQPLDEWLLELVTTIHDMHTRAGRGLWQLAAAADDELTPQLQLVNERRRVERRNATAAIARAAWRRAGGLGRPPVVINDACALTISSYATQSMVRDYGRDTRQIARSTTALLVALLRAEVDARLGASTGTRTKEHDG